MSDISTTTLYPEAWLGTWDWQGLQVSFVRRTATIEPNSKSKPSPVVLIHGFGACKEHWRHNIDAIGQDRDVYALDLVGFGASAKPYSRLIDEPGTEGWVYGIDSWGAQVRDFIIEHIKGPVQLVGNSIGGVVALNAARMLEEEKRAAKQVILIDCAQRALDDKRLAEQPALRRWGRPALKACVRQRWLTSTLFKALVKPGVIRRVLEQAYPSGKNIDEELINLLLKPATAPGAEEAFRGFINLFKDRLAPDLLQVLHTPVTMIWGEQDPWESAEVATQWKSFGAVKSLVVIPNLGHCPHDEDPETVNPIMIKLLREGDLEAC